MSTEQLDFTKLPVRPPPSGVQSNFVDPPTRAGQLTAALAVLIALSTTFVLLRLYTRLVLLARSLDIGDCAHSLLSLFNSPFSAYYFRSFVGRICMLALLDPPQPSLLCYLV